MTHTWVTSMGGPLILVPESACHLWGGAPRNYPDDEGAYGYACAVEDLVGFIDVGPVKALVLGDDPAATRFLPGLGVLVR
ncbi:Imm21 family immunity protein [Streptomyces sp. NPDC056682]|uniref:Imm21 family immunity protein n=1 Tax=Streptomyces sp. NPDC056682 TaxID=3345909 RepID=UPI00369CEABA